MKKLIAKRPIQYMGRTYERGAVIPTQDHKMVEAWLKANSAAWTDTDMEDFARAVIQEAARRSKVNDMAAEAIRAMGVTIEDDAGEFVGASSMEEQICAIVAGGRESAQDGDDSEDGQDPAEGANATQDGEETAEEAGNSEDSEAPAMLTGHLDAADLEKWRKGDLERLAEDMGVDISKAKNNAERAAILAAVEVQAPADDPTDDGSAQ